MSKIKTYRLIGLKSFMGHIEVEVKGESKTKLIEFNGGGKRQGQLVPGFLKTEDKDIQSYLEKSPHFNLKWELVDKITKQEKTEVLTSEKGSVQLKPNVNSTSAADSQSEDTETSTFSSKVSTMGEAQAFILKNNAEIDPKELQGNRAFLVDKAKELGFDFPNFQ